MVREMASLGFEYVELSHGIRITLVPGILRAVESGLVKVSSCHNFCPLPAGVTYPAPNLYQPSSRDPRERDQWVRSTKRSIDFAAQVKAGVLVCHLGSVGFFWFNPANRISRYVGDKEGADYRQDEKYLVVRDAAVAKLKKAMPRYVDNVLDCIKQVLDHAAVKGVKLGFENRERVDELPLDDGFDALFEALPADAPVGYWHDAGHADIKEKLALMDHRQHLEKQASRLLGCHLHDVSVEGDDHQPIGSGRIDFDMLSGFWREHHRLILELSPRLKTEQVLASKARVEQLLSQKAGC